MDVSVRAMTVPTETPNYLQQVHIQCALVFPMKNAIYKCTLKIKYIDVSKLAKARRDVPVQSSAGIENKPIDRCFKVSESKKERSSAV